MAEIFRDTAAGAFLRLVSRNRLLRYPEEMDDFQLPDAWRRMLNDEDIENEDLTRPQSRETRQQQTEEFKPGAAGPATDEKKPSSGRRGSNDDSVSLRNGDAMVDVESATLKRPKTREETLPYSAERREVERTAELERTRSIPIAPRRTKDGAILVGWYSTDDPANPQNWSNARRAAVTSIICFYTFVVYMSSAIYTTSEHGVMQEFGVDATRAALGLSLFVLGYGIGPLIFSPLSELPYLGRNPLYVATMFLFVIVSIPAAVPTNYPGLMVLRFLQGFFGSPCLASGGASVQDMYSLRNLPYAMMAWVSSAYFGPSLGPLLSGFSVPVMGWRWSMLEIVWAASPALLLMFIFLPETSGPTILLRRAARLRKVTGDPRFLSQGELDARGQRFSAVLVDAMIKPIEITVKDPAILFVQVYTGIIYGIYYSFFEVFPLVYPVMHGMSPGQIGLVFLCLLVACLLGFVAYSSYVALYMNPRIEARGDPVHETRLVPALGAAFGPTIGLFIFAWTASPDIHWIAPTVGITLYGGAAFVVMQCIFIYVPLSYPKYAASLFAANDFFRSSLAFASVLFARPMYQELGVARGTSLLGGLSVIGIVGIWVLYIYGARLRAMSKFAVSSDVE